MKTYRRGGASRERNVLGYVLHWHWTNDNEKGYRDSTGEYRTLYGPPTRGRVWFRLQHRPTPQTKAEEDAERHLLPNELLTWSFEWAVPAKSSVGVSFNWGGDETDFSFHVGIGAAFFVNVNFPWKSRARLFVQKIAGGEERENSIRFMDGGVWWNFWRDDSSWSNQVHHWQNGVFRPLDAIFGRTEHAVELQDAPVMVTIPMPEGFYEASVVMMTETWKRPRLPWVSKRIRRHHTELKKGIPEPGKGENSWDCGEDSISGMTGPAHDVAEAIGHLVTSVYRTRLRRGGSFLWKPKETTEGT